MSRNGAEGRTKGVYDGNAPSGCAEEAERSTLSR